MRIVQHLLKIDCAALHLHASVMKSSGIIISQEDTFQTGVCCIQAIFFAVIIQCAGLDKILRRYCPIVGICRG